jgi:hypothetical protein
MPNLIWFLSLIIVYGGTNFFYNLIVFEFVLSFLNISLSGK